MGAASGMKLSDLTEEMIENSPLWDMDLNVSQLQLPQSVLCNDNALSFLFLGCLFGWLGVPAVFCHAETPRGNDRL